MTVPEGKDADDVVARATVRNLSSLAHRADFVVACLAVHLRGLPERVCDDGIVAASGPETYDPRRLDKRGVASVPEARIEIADQAASAEFGPKATQPAPAVSSAPESVMVAQNRTSSAFDSPGLRFGGPPDNYPGHSCRR
jgi:hypothetical protein